MLEKPRQRSVGGGRKARLRTSQDKLFYILFYFKCYIMSGSIVSV
ncbi:hypothetical protein [Okeania sp. SIO2F5]|nr:hypothetical protein [Okeania sp. SIO2F5]